jgi:uncharacterized protein (TIGR03437 family)
MFRCLMTRGLMLRALPILCAGLRAQFRDLSCMEGGPLSTLRRLLRPSRLTPPSQVRLELRGGPQRALPCLILAIVLSCCASAQVRILAITDGATFTPGVPNYGSLATVFCTGLTGIHGVQSATQYPLPNQIAGVSVRFVGNLAPLLAVADLGSYQQVNFQVPAGGSPNMGVDIVVSQGATAAWPVQAQAAWGVFFTDSMGYAISQHVDYSLVTPSHPAKPGEVLIVYATNLDSLSYTLNAPPIGSPAPADPLPSLMPSSDLRSAPFVTVNGSESEMLYSGLAPGLVGVFQVNFRLPSATPDGDALLNAVTKTLCINPGLPSGFCIDGKTSLGAKIPVKAAPAPY